MNSSLELNVLGLIMVGIEFATSCYLFYETKFFFSSLVLALGIMKNRNHQHISCVVIRKIHIIYIHIRYIHQTTKSVPIHADFVNCHTYWIYVEETLLRKVPELLSWRWQRRATKILTIRCRYRLPGRDWGIKGEVRGTPVPLGPPVGRVPLTHAATAWWSQGKESPFGYM